MKLNFTKLLLSAGVIAGLSSGVRAQNYCTATATSTYDSDITNVELGSIKNRTSGGACALYTYFNTMSTDLDINGSYQLTVELGVNNPSNCGSDVYTKSWVAWIDFNGDYDFDDPGERIGEGPYTNGTFSASINFTVPCSSLGGKTRLRICAFEQPASSITSCMTYAYGEVEDYDVVIKPATSLSADFALPDTVYVNSPAFFTNTNPCGYTHKWFNSAVDPTLSTPVTTNINYEYTFTSTGTYTIRLITSDKTNSAQKSKTITVINPTSLPEPNFVASMNQVDFVGNPVEIQLYDLSLYGATSWEWTITPDFNNGAPWFYASGNQYSRNPTLFFYDVGTYEVCLTVSNGLGTSTPLCRSAYITIAPPNGKSFVNIMGEDPNCSLDSGLIYDSGGPLNNYSTNEYNEFTIQPCGASSVTLYFNSFNLQSGDYLNIFDGENTSAPQIGSFTGTTLPNAVTASSGKMTLLMTTNGSTAPGFAATWSAVIPQNGAPMADFDIPDTLWSCSGGADITFWNATSGIVDGQATYEWIMDYDPQISYPAGYYDYDDESPEWTVPSSTQYEEYDIRLVAITCEGNDTIVKTLRVSPTTNKPIVDFSASNRRVSTGSVVELREQTTAGCSYEWVINPPTGWAFESGYSATDQNIKVKFNAAGSYHVDLKVTNDNGTTTKSKTNYIDVIDYCTPAVAIGSISDVGINSVIIEDIDNTTPSGVAPGYSNFTEDFVVTLTAGQTYSLQVGRNSTVNPVNRKAWIDFNRDGVFTANEEILSEGSAYTTSYTSTFTVPDYTALVPGESRMRVGVAMGNGSNTPCGPVQVGEYEDYGVMLRLDDQPPVITLKGMDTVRVEVNGMYTEDSATAMDNIQGDISSDIVITNQVDLTQPGIYFVHYNVMDKSGLAAVTKTRTVIVSSDLTPPVITLTGGNPYQHPVLTPYTEPGVVDYDATDAPSGKNVKSDVVISGAVDVNHIGDYTLRYTVSDLNGNTTTVTRLVQVRDLDAPIITSPANVFWQVGTPFVNPVTITDNFDMNPVVTMSGNMNVNVFGKYTVTFMAEDASGNMATPVSVVFEVGDSIAPVISTLPGSEVLVVEVNTNNFFEPPVSAKDNYFPNVSLVRDASAVKIYELGTYPIIYTATDGAGNTSTYTRTIYVVDTEKPVVIAPPMNLQRWSGNYDPFENITAMDNYWSPSWFDSNQAIEVVLDNVDINYPGVYNIVYRATDGSGNVSALTTRIVNVWTPTGVDEVDLQNMVQVYPNPSSGRFTVKLDVSINTSNAQIQVVDMLGHTVLKAGSEVFVNGEASLNLDGVSNGVYMVQISTEQGVITKRITINK